MQFLPLSIAFVCFLATAQALHLAERVHQLSYNKRATYEGGWPLALTGADCPSDAPVACDTYSGSVNPVCCPNGQFCKGIDWPYCCPTSGDCVNVVQNLPVCANSTWNMYALSKTTFFCCEPGQIGIIPLRGYTGICGYPDQAVASSLIATQASQIGGAAVTTVVGNTGGEAAPTSTKTITSSLKGGGVTTITSLVGQTAAAGTDASQSTATASSASSSSTTGAGATGTKKKASLGTGVIVGIAASGLLLLVIALLVFLLVQSRKKSRQNSQQLGSNQGYQSNGNQSGGGQPVPMYNAAPAPYQGPVGEYKTPAVGYTQPAPVGQGKHGGGYVRSQEWQGQQGNHGTPTPEPQGKHGGGYLRHEESQSQGQQDIHEIPTPEPQRGEYVSPLVEAPSRWERRVEIGSGK